jgi:hypothetical protein
MIAPAANVRVWLACGHTDIEERFSLIEERFSLASRRTLSRVEP